MRQVLRFGDEIARGHYDVFGQPAIHVLADDLVLWADSHLACPAEFAFAAGDQRVHSHFVAGSPADDLLTDHVDNAGDVDAGGERQGNGAEFRPAPDADIQPIQGAGMHLNPYFIVGWPGDRHLIQP